jgi:hypothetical protein
MVMKLTVTEWLFDACAITIGLTRVKEDCQSLIRALMLIHQFESLMYMTVPYNQLLGLTIHPRQSQLKRRLRVAA